MSDKKSLMQEIKNEIEQCDEKQREQLMCAIDVIRKGRNSENDEAKAEESLE